MGVDSDCGYHQSRTDHKGIYDPSIPQSGWARSPHRCWHRPDLVTRVERPQRCWALRQPKHRADAGHDLMKVPYERSPIPVLPTFNEIDIFEFIQEHFGS